MSDERDDEQVDPPESPESPESPETPETPEEFEIAEMSPPPPPPDADEPTAMGEPVAPPPPPPLPADPPADSPADSLADPPVADDLSAVPPPFVPTGPGPDPTVDPPTDDEQSWPGSAKAAVAVLVVLALLGVAGTVIGLTRASSTDDDLDEVREELALSEDRVVALEDQLASLGDETGNLSERLDQLTSERDQAMQERDQAVAEREEAAAVAEAERALLEAEIESLEAEIESLEAEIESLQTELDEALGGLEELFPLSFSFDLGQLDIAGDYDVSFTEIGCAGLDLCGSPPPASTATIISAGGLRLNAPGLFEIPLVVVDGTPFGVADSEALVGPCGATPRLTSLTMALFDDAIEIDESGNVDVTALGATIVIDAPAVDECEIGRVWYRAELTARG